MKAPLPQDTLPVPHNPALLSRESLPASVGKVTNATNLPSYLDPLHSPLASHASPRSKENSHKNSHNSNKGQSPRHPLDEGMKVSRQKAKTPKVSTITKETKAKVPKSRRCYFMREDEVSPDHSGAEDEPNMGKNQQIKLKNSPHPQSTLIAQQNSVKTIPYQNPLQPNQASGDELVTYNSLPYQARSSNELPGPIETQKTIPIILPKFIEVEVPYYVPAKYQGKEHSPESNKSRVSIRSDQSSIEQIITDFSRKIDSIRQSQQDSHNFHEYRPEPQLLHPSTPKNAAFSSQTGRNSQGLPLDSFEEKPNIRLKSQMSQSYSSPPRQRNQIWDCPEMELKQDFLEQLREGPEKFELKSDQGTISAFNSPPSNKLQVQLQSVSQQNKKLYETVSFLQQRLVSAEETIHQMQNHQQKYINEHQEKNHRYAEVIEENRELNNIIIHFKEQVFKNQTQLKDQSKQIAQISEELEKALKQLQYKENCLQQLVRVYREKEEENSELMQTVSELQGHAKQLVSQYQGKLESAYKQMDKLEEKIEMYHRRMQESGFTFNMGEAEEIRHIIEDKEAQTSSRINTIQRKYQKEVDELKMTQSRLQKDKEELQKQVNNKVSQQDINRLLANYDMELKNRDEEILKLKSNIRQQKSQKSVQANPETANFIEQSKLQYDLIKTEKALSKAQEQIAYQRRQKEKVVKKLVELSQGYEKYMQDYAAYLDMKTNEPKPNRTIKRKPTTTSRKTRTVQNNSEESFASVPSSLPVLEVRQSKKAESESIGESFLNVIPSTLDIVFENSCGWGHKEKCELGVALVEYGIEMIDKFRKLPALNPCELLVTHRDNRFEIVYQSSGESPSVLTDRYLLYRSPQVLLGFSETESSYVWTIGLVMDAFLNGAFFYRKLSDITNIKNNYYCRDEKLSLGGTLKQTMVKNQKLRPNLKWLLKEFTKELS